MWAPSVFPSQRAACNSGYRAEYRRRTSRTASPGSIGSSKTWEPLPSPPTYLVTHVVTSTVAVIRSVIFTPAIGRDPSCLSLSPEVSREPVQAEILERLPLGPARLSIVADRLVPDVQHVIPLLHDGLVLRRPVDRLRAVALRRILHIGPDPATKVEGAQDRGGPPTETRGFGERVVPARGGRQCGSEQLDTRPEREGASPERVLEVSPAQDAAHEARDLLAVERIDPCGQPDLRLERRVGALHGPVGRGAGVEHLLPSAAVVVTAGRSALLSVDGAPGRLAAHLLRSTLDALGEHVTETLAMGDHLEQTIGAVHVTPLETEAHLLLGQVALLHALHHPSADPAELVDVDAGAIEPRVEPRHRVLVGEPDRPASAGPSFVLGLVHELALTRTTRNDLDVAVPHPAGVALVTSMVVVPAQPGRRPLVHVHGAEVRRVVLDRQHAQLVEIRHAGQRAPVVERARRRISLEIVGDLVRGLHQSARVVRRQGFGAAHDAHGLQLLLSHHGAAAVLRGNVTVVPLDGCEPYAMLTGRPDGVDRHAVARQAVLLLERLLG